jgi:hypothetical protein
MRYLILIFALLGPMFLKAQRRETPPKDSTQIYRRQLSTLWRNTYDSLRSSEKYKELLSNIDRLQGKSGDYGGIVVFADLVHSDYSKLNESIVKSGFSPLKSNLLRIGFGASNKSGKLISDIYLAIVGFNNESKKINEKIKTSVASLLQYDFGYDLTKSSFIDIYPFVGLSLRFSNLNYTKPAEINPNYTNISNILVSNQTAYSTSFRLGYQAGIGIDLNLSSSKNQKESTIFFTKFGVNRPFSVDKYNVEGVNYKPEVRQGIWVWAFGLKFVGKQ